jgi:hypothetical protein
MDSVELDVADPENIGAVTKKLIADYFLVRCCCASSSSRFVRFQCLVVAGCVRCPQKVTIALLLRASACIQTVVHFSDIMKRAL